MATALKILYHHRDYGNQQTMLPDCTQERGKLAGITCGEGFRMYRGHAHPRTPLLEELLGADVLIHCRT